jgi:hypothetical protein
MPLLTRTAFHEDRSEIAHDNVELARAIASRRLARLVLEIVNPLLFRSREPSEHPLSDHGLFELGKDSHHLKHCPTSRCGGIEALLMQEKIDAFGV